MRLLTEEEIRDVARGSAILGTGGGGDPYLGLLAALEALREFGPPRLVKASELADDELIGIPGLMGSPVPILEKFPFGPEMVECYRAFESAMGRSPTALMAFEIGGVNSMLPLALGARLGIPIVDGDGMGRAYPESPLTTFTLFGHVASPMALADEFGNRVVVHAVDSVWTDRIARPVAVQFGAICACMTLPLSGKDVKEAAVLDTISFAEQIGRALRKAHADKREPVPVLVDVTDGIVLFEGKIVDVKRWIEDGWAIGAVVIDGSGIHAGRKMSVHFKNENLVAVVDDQIVATVPDLITVIDSERADAITTERLRYGHRVVVLGMRCHHLWRTPAGAKLGGPRHFGFDIDYVPLERRYADYERQLRGTAVSIAGESALATPGARNANRD